MQLNLTFQDGKPPRSGTYLAVVILDGEKVVMEADYTDWNDQWEVQQLQHYDGPYWEDYGVDVVSWAHFPFQDFI